jgi:hypothetical protein
VRCSASSRRTVLPPLLSQPFAVRLGPARCEPFLLEKLRQDDVPILQDLDFDRHTGWVHDATYVGCPASKTPQHTRARLDGVTTQAEHSGRGLFSRIRRARVKLVRRTLLPHRSSPPVSVQTTPLRLTGALEPLGDGIVL